MECITLGLNKFWWPQRQVGILFNQNEILCQIGYPVPIGRRFLELLPDDFTRCNEALNNKLE